MEFHIRCKPEDIARYVFTPGSHSRAKKIAAHFDDARLVSDSRGYLVYTGYVDGIRMTVSSTGMGGPTTAICLEELAHMGADTFIRVGSCGTFQDDITVGVSCRYAVVVAIKSNQRQGVDFAALNSPCFKPTAWD